MVNQILSTYNYVNITKYLKENSNLPGRSANLTLAYQVADYYKENEYDIDYLCSVFTYKEHENTPEEFVSMCKIISLGSIFKRLNQDEQSKVLHLLSQWANESWRIKEAVAMCFQRIGYNNGKILINTFNSYLEKGTYSQKRAIIATLADYELLENKKLLDYSIQVSGKLLDEIIVLDSSVYKNEDFKVLQKGLAYAISVFVALNPKQGFELLHNYVEVNNKVVKRIIKSNLEKKRLSSKYPTETEKLRMLLGL